MLLTNQDLEDALLALPGTLLRDRQMQIQSENRVEQMELELARMKAAAAHEIRTSSEKKPAEEQIKQDVLLNSAVQEAENALRAVRKNADYDRVAVLVDEERLRVYALIVRLRSSSGEARIES